VTKQSRANAWLQISQALAAHDIVRTPKKCADKWKYWKSDRKAFFQERAEKQNKTGK